jgi:predicted amidohydrolase
MIVDPNAEVLGEVQEFEDIAYADLDENKIVQTRKVCSGMLIK